MVGKVSRILFWKWEKEEKCHTLSSITHRRMGEDVPEISRGRCWFFVVVFLFCFCFCFLGGLSFNGLTQKRRF